MTMDAKQVNELKDELIASWKITMPDDHAISNSEQIFEALHRRIAELLCHDMQRLLTAIYRLDVSERNFDAAMSLSTTEEVARALARSVLERELQRLHSRRQHRN